MCCGEIFGSEKGDVTGRCKKLYNELDNLYSSPNIRVIK
jgi:hypothetical protein